MLSRGLTTLYPRQGPSQVGVRIGLSRGQDTARDDPSETEVTRVLSEGTPILTAGEIDSKFPNPLYYVNGS